MALPAGRYGVTKNQLLKIKKLPMNTMKLIEELAEKYDLLGTAAFKNSSSVVTDSTDLVESGAVYDVVGWGNKNLLPNNATSQTINGVTFTVNENGSVTVNGTAQGADATLNIFEGTKPPFNGYVLSGCPSDGGISKYYIAYSKHSSPYTLYGVDTGNGVTISIPSASENDDYFIFMRIKNGQTVSNLVFKPMIRKADVTDATYEPYHASVDESKADNSVIGTVEDGTTASQAYAVNDVFIRNGALCKVTSAISQGDTLSNQFTVTNVGAILTALLNA